jgi:hypothetical protein
MNPEERLSQTLHATHDAARPSPDLTDRIVERVSVGGGRTVRANVRIALAGMAVLVMVLALVPLAVNLRSNGPPSDGTVGPLTHWDGGGLAFAYPASWSAKPDVGVTSNVVLWTGRGLVDCTAPTPGAVQCGPRPVDPGQVIVEVSKYFAGAPLAIIDPTDPSALTPGEKYVTVGGLPAVLQDVSPDSNSRTTLDWQLSVPGQLYYRYSIHAEFKNPGVDQMRAQVEALVASVRYDPPAPVLGSANGPPFAARWLDQTRTSDPAFACFPDVPGQIATATVTRMPFAQLVKPLPVTCGTAVEPVPIGLWRIVLTESWTADSDRTAGTLTTTVWLNPDGTENTSAQPDPRLLLTPESPALPSDIPYLH